MQFMIRTLMFAIAAVAFERLCSVRAKPRVGSENRRVPLLTDRGLGLRQDCPQWRTLLRCVD